uniref:M15 family metallopeptidase n=2 Tax=uncultured Oscillibacter sp. TaxID=876091 RepID=UPI00260EDBF1
PDLPPEPPEGEPQEGEPQEGEPQEGEPQEGEAQDGDGEEPEYETYFQIMTNNGRFNLGSFLARVTSAHNRGIALDLTLEKIDGGEELEMQSAIHDLSWYSAAYLNNDNAKLLEKYMTATGMRGLSSEWWHFQDDETREAIGLTSYLFKGVNMGGWTKDDRGWRYRDADGTIYKNTTVTVDGKRYTADADGYVRQ